MIEVKRIKYQTKFLLYHTAIMIFIILGIGGCFYSIAIDEIQDKEKRDFQIIVEKAAAQLDNLYYEMDRAALQIAANPEVVNVFQKLSREPQENYFRENPIDANNLKKLLESYNFKMNGHARICLYNENEDFICTANRAVTTPGIQKFFEEDFEIVKKFFSEEGRFVYYREPTQDVLAYGQKDEGKSISVIREIKDYFSGSSKCGYVEVQESVEKLDTVLGDLGTGVRAEILDMEQDIIYCVADEGLKEKESEIYSFDIALENAPYTLRFYKNSTEYLHSMNQIYLIIGVTIFVVFSVAVCLERILIWHLSKPLIDLDRSLKTVTMDNLHVNIIREDSEDLVIRLEDSFNSMLQKLNDSMQKQVIAKTNEVKSHFFALQSQMNPHFLHNILAIIAMEAQLDGNKKIPDICQKLGKILRYNSEMGDGYSTIKLECEISQDYMELMKIRYEDAFEYDISIEGDVGSVKMPKLIIQPLCENCFQHGFKHVEQIWRLTIRVWSDSECWYIMVRDNGRGFSDTFLEKFREQKQELDLSDAKEVLEHISIGGLSIPNIYTRMRLACNKEFVFELYNENGAVVLLGGGRDDKSFGSGG